MLVRRGYKARDIDFASALEQTTASQGSVERTHSAHIPLSGSAAQPDVMYRVPAEVAPDGNSVDATLNTRLLWKTPCAIKQAFSFSMAASKGIKNAIKGDS